MKRISIFFGILISIIAFSCTRNSGNVAITLDISDANYLLLSEPIYDGSPESVEIEQSGTNLMKMSVQGGMGTLAEVYFTDADGEWIENNFTSIEVDEICEFTDDYCCFFGTFECIIDPIRKEKVILKSLLVRKSDGAIFDFEGYFPPKGITHLGQRVQTDRFGNMYFISMGIKKLSPVTGGQLALETLLTRESQTESFYIDYEGNCFYSTGQNQNNYGWYYDKVKLNSGPIIFNEQLPLRYLFQGHDHNTYGIWRDKAETLHTCQVDIDDSVIIENLADIPIPDDTYGYDGLYYDDANNTIVLLRRNSEFGVIGMLFNEAEKKSYYLKQSEELGTVGYWLIKNTRDFIFLQSGEPDEQNSIYRIAKNEYVKIDDENYQLSSPVKFEIPDDFQVYTYDILDTDKITFTALRYSDGRYIVATIDTNGQVAILSETDNSKYHIVTRL